FALKYGKHVELGTLSKGTSEALRRSEHPVRHRALYQIPRVLDMCSQRDCQSKVPEAVYAADSMRADGK
ncbi:hypothetical protein LPJ62_006653, partial [Coemansia sp. RSA 2167]